MYTVYIVKCADASLYTGYAKNITARLSEHNHGKKGAKYTRARRPVKLVYTERFRLLGKAMSREAAIKRLSRAQKLKLITTKKQP